MSLIVPTHSFFCCLKSRLIIADRTTLTCGWQKSDDDVYWKRNYGIKQAIFLFPLQQNNASSELNQTDGFLSSLLNDEDLQLMDMAMTEGELTSM